MVMVDERSDDDDRRWGGTRQRLHRLLIDGGVVLVGVLVAWLASLPLQPWTKLAMLFAEAHGRHPALAWLGVLTLLGALVVLLLQLGRANRALGRRAMRESRLLALARQDPLTTVANRRGLMARLADLEDAYAAAGTPYSVLCVDLDRFKPINDRLGHAAGDVVLTVVAKRLVRMVRDGDLVARLGGDELVILLCDVHHPGDLARFAERVVRAVGERIVYGEHVLSVSASVGAASRCDHGHDAEGTLAAADAALLRAKSAGGRSWLLARSRDLAPRLAPAAQRRVRAAA